MPLNPIGCGIEVTHAIERDHLMQFPRTGLEEVFFLRVRSDELCKPDKRFVSGWQSFGTDRCIWDVGRGRYLHGYRLPIALDCGAAPVIQAIGCQPLGHLPVFWLSASAVLARHKLRSTLIPDAAVV